MPASEADLKLVLEAMAPAPSDGARERVLEAMAGRAGVAVPPRRTRWRWALAALAVVLFAVSPPGQAIAERLGELVGIGGDSTIDHSEDSDFPARGRGIVIAAGTLPRGPDYEIVAFANEPRPEERKFVGGSKVATCLSLDFPETEKHGEFNTTCFGAGEVTMLHTSGSSDYGAGGELGSRYRYTVSGETSDEVASVEVSYLNEAGDRVAAPVAYGVADDEVLAAIGGEFPGGEFVAFIPDDGATGRPVTTGPSVLGSVDVKALDADGNVLAAENWGDQLNRSRGAAQQPTEPTEPAEPERDAPRPGGPMGAVQDRIDLLWLAVIERARAGELEADVDPKEVIRVMNLALDRRREDEVIAMVEKLRAAEDLPPLGTPLPKPPTGAP